jgi:hypothetical protein
MGREGLAVECSFVSNAVQTEEVTEFIILGIFLGWLSDHRHRHGNCGCILLLLLVSLVRSRKRIAGLVISAVGTPFRNQVLALAGY